MQDKILRKVLHKAFLTHCIFPTKLLKKNVMVNRCYVVLGELDDHLYSYFEPSFHSENNCILMCFTVNKKSLIVLKVLIMKFISSANLPFSFWQLV